MRSVTSLIALTAATAGLIAATGTSAEAVRASSAPLTDSSGATNGCIGGVSVSVGRAEPASGTQQQPISIVVRPTLTCEADAKVQWYTTGSSLSEVMDDGSLRVIYGPGLNSRTQTSEPLTGETWSASHTPCRSIDGKGNHTWLVRATLKTKQSKDDPNPFVAKVASQQLLHCS